MKKLSILLLCILFSILSCKKIIDSTSSLSKDNIKVEDLKTIIVNKEYSISVPEYMKEMKSLHDDASFEYANVFKETYTIVIDEGKKEVEDYFRSIELYDDELTPLENYSNFQISSLKESIENPIITKQNIKVANISSKYYEIHGKVDNFEIGYLIGFVEGKDKMYMVMCWSLDARYKKYENTFKLIQSTFKFI